MNKLKNIRLSTVVATLAFLQIAYIIKIIIGGVDMDSPISHYESMVLHINIMTWFIVRAIENK